MERAVNSGALTGSVFYILLRPHQPAYSYVMMKNIAEMTNRRISPGAGSLHGALDTLQKRGWIRVVDEHLSDRRIRYIITDIGKQLFEGGLIQLEEMPQNVKKVKGAGSENKC